MSGALNHLGSLPTGSSSMLRLNTARRMLEEASQSIGRIGTLPAGTEPLFRMDTTVESQFLSGAPSAFVQQSAVPLAGAALAAAFSAVHAMGFVSLFSFLGGVRGPLGQSLDTPGWPVVLKVSVQRIADLAHRCKWRVARFSSLVFFRVIFFFRASTEGTTLRWCRDRTDRAASRTLSASAAPGRRRRPLNRRRPPPPPPPPPPSTPLPVRLFFEAC